LFCFSFISDVTTALGYNMLLLPVHLIAWKLTYESSGVCSLLTH